jgi:dipeptidyl aminopeptidase/acylaminoacyl peptidase
VLVAAFVLPAAARAAPLEAYGRLPSIEQAAVSPDGERIAVAVSDGEARSIVILRAKDKQRLGTLVAGESKIRDLTWAGDDHLLISASVTAQLTDVEAPRQEWWNVLDVDLRTGAKSFPLEGVSGALSAAQSSPAIRILDGRPFAFLEAAYFVGGMGRDSLFKIDIDHVRTSLVEVGQDGTQSWVVGADGAALAHVDLFEQSGHWTLHFKDSGGWRQAMAVDDPLGFDGDIGLSRDGKTVYRQVEQDGAEVYEDYDPAKRAWLDPFASLDDATPIVDPATGRLIGLHALSGDTDDYRFFDPADQAVWAAAVKAFPGERLTLQSLSANHHKLVLLADSPTEGPAYAFVDIDSHAGYFLGVVYDDLQPADIAPVKPVAFKAADGLPLTGYLTLPNGREAKNLPLIVFPHGGPAARDEPGFDWWAQAMASRGYAVLQVNYRGSDGLGRKLLDAGFGEWGAKMQTDLSDGVRYLAGQGTIDPKRVCIVGASYGGYAALAGATLDTGVYRCAVSVAGISDLHRFVVWANDQHGVTARRYWDRFMGASKPEDPHLAAISPADHITAATPPILLIHGKDDTVVPFEQSQIMADALKKAGQTPDLVILRHEDHWLSHGDTRLQMLQATMDFVEKNNPPG